MVFEFGTVMATMNEKTAIQFLKTVLIVFFWKNGVRFFMFLGLNDGTIEFSQIP